MAKKTITFLLALTMLFAATTAFASEDKPIQLRINGEEVAMSVEPQSINGTLMVPLMDFTKIINVHASVWDNEKKSVLLSNLCAITVGENTAKIYEKSIRAYLLGDDSNVTLLPFSEPAFLYQGKMMVPLDLIQSLYDINVKVVFDSEKNSIDCYYLTDKNDIRKFVVTADADSLNAFLKQYYFTDSFNADYFDVDRNNLVDGTGTIVYTGKYYTARKIIIQVLDNMVISIEDQTDYTIEPEYTITEKEDYTQLVSKDFDIRLYVPKTINSKKEFAPYAEIRYIGTQDMILLYHAMPGYHINVDGEEYSLRQDCDCVGVHSRFEKDEVNTITLPPHAKRYVPKGDYTIYFIMDATNENDGEPFKINFPRTTTVK